MYRPENAKARYRTAMVHYFPCSSDGEIVNHAIGMSLFDYTSEKVAPVYVLL